MNRDDPDKIGAGAVGDADHSPTHGRNRPEGSLVSRLRQAARRPLRITLLVVIVGGLGGLGGLGSPAAEAQTGAVGQWAAPFSWPNVTIHTTLLPTGKVLTYSYPNGSDAVGESESWLWNAANSQFTEVPVANGSNIFCSGHALLADGQVVSFGGTDPDSPLPDFWGQNQVNRFNTATQQWSYQSAMKQSRWYPAVTTLSDGKLLISSGIDQNGDGNDEQEIYNPATGATTQLPSSADRYSSLYPWQYLLPNGRVFSASNGNDVDILNLSTNTWSSADATSFGGRDQGTSVLLPLKAPGYNPEVMILGGGYPDATSSVERIDLGAGSPQWVNAASISKGRRHANSLLLPNGKVLVTGGTGGDNDPARARLAAELYDPAANTWTTMASMQRPRMYHSATILLPDARVLTAGTDGELTAEIYSPPYLFNGPRPTISSAPASVGWGATFPVSTPSASSIAKVMLMKPSSVTHSINMGQRAIELGFTAGAGSITITAPPNGKVAPPGHYMLFILNGSGVPSIAKWVHLSGSPASTPAPTATPSPTPTASPAPTPPPTPPPTPAPTPTPMPTPPPTSAPSAADLDCDGVVDSVDALRVLRYAADLPANQSGTCPPPGTSFGGGVMGDVDCSGSVNAVDAIIILRFAAGLEQSLSCPP